jgi:hypothetical protein
VADELTPAVLDVPLSTLSQTPPDHAGPMGRLVAMKNAEVRQYLPPQAGGAGGGSTPQAVLVQQREGFVSVSGETRNSTDGTGPQDPLVTGELLATLGDQLVNIGNSVPKVYNGSTWTTYRDAETRVLTGKLSETTLHTSSKTIQACDSAVIGDVTCFVWTETNENLTASYIGFKSALGAWVVTPRVLHAMTDETDHALAKVVSDGTRFWVFYNRENLEAPSRRIHVEVYDTHGVLLSGDVKARDWTTSPGFWDIVTTPSGAVLLAQPASFAVGSDVHVEFTKFTFTGPSTIVQSSHTDASIHCQGPVAWLTNDAGFSAFSYLATLGPTEAAVLVRAYEVDESTLAQVHEFVVTTLGNQQTIDSMTGYIRAGSGIEVVVALSTLSEYSPPAGPPNDPGLRNVKVWNCSRTNVTTLIKQANGVVLQSRAFRVLTSPPEAPDYYAVTYYQSGGGIARKESLSIAHTLGDLMIGEAEQTIDVEPGNITTGAPHTIGSSSATLFVTQAIATITHNAGDSATAATQQWKFLNATFAQGIFGTPSGMAIGSYLNITGSSITTNNQSYLIIGFLSTTIIVTEPVGSLGHTMVDDTLVGVTASLTSNVTLTIPTAAFTGSDGKVSQLNPSETVPDDMIPSFIPGTITVAGASHSGNNRSFTVARFLQHLPAIFPPGAASTPYQAESTLIVCTPAGSPVTEPLGTGVTVTLAPVFQNTWIFGSESFNGTYVGGNLIVSGAGDGNNGEFAITSVVSDAIGTASQPGQLPQRFQSPLPSVKVQIPEASLALTIKLQSVTFNDSYIGSFITIAGADHDANNTTFVIVGVVSAHVVQVRPTLGVTGQRDDLFGVGVTATIVFSTEPQPIWQPCWFLTPLSVAQQTAGRFEYGIAYADWRRDGATLSDPGIGADFSRNNFPFALSSVVKSNLVDNVVALPYRALSFTAGQVVRSGPNTIGVSAVQESTVGIKAFTLAGAAFGQAVQSSGELLLPGAMAAAFSASGFHEDGVNIGFEQPFLVSQSTDGSTLGLTPAIKYEYVVVGELMDENGDRSFTIPSPPLSVGMTGTNNIATIGGRLPGPTNRTLVGLSIYRTSVQSDTPTVQHYKATNDLDVNGIGFTFTSVNGGAAKDTWQFVDSIPDVAILSSEILYTDKGLTPRYPAPAYSQGVGSWCNRAWLVGYDGAIWMSGEKTEGDALWFTPLFRYVLPTDDKPVALAPLDEFLLVFCSRSIWYIPKTDFPSANLAVGSLPTPVQLPFQNGCTGWALTIRAGVAYSSTAGGVWLITRQLTNAWLSQDVQTDLAAPATSMLVDERQRLFVFAGTTSAFVFDQVSQCWSTWVLPAAAALASAWRGHATYQDLLAPAHVAVHTPGAFADTINGVRTGAPPDITLAGVSMAGVRSFKRCWAIQIVGQYKGPHNLNAVVSYPDEDGQVPTTYGPFTVDPASPYVYEVNPDPEEASTFGLRIFADFGGVENPGNSFTLELVSFEVGVEGNINRVVAAKRIPSNG